MSRPLFCPTCGYVDCVCKIRVSHVEGCKFRGAMMCPVGIACDHGRDVCPICDPCTCADVSKAMATSE